MGVLKYYSFINNTINGIIGEKNKNSYKKGLKGFYTTNSDINDEKEIDFGNYKLDFIMPNVNIHFVNYKLTSLNNLNINLDHNYFKYTKCIFDFNDRNIKINMSKVMLDNCIISCQRYDVKANEIIEINNNSTLSYINEYNVNTNKLYIKNQNLGSLNKNTITANDVYLEKINIYSNYTKITSNVIHINNSNIISNEIIFDSKQVFLENISFDYNEDDDSSCGFVDLFCRTIIFNKNIDFIKNKKIRIYAENIIVNTDLYSNGEIELIYSNITINGSINSNKTVLNGHEFDALCVINKENNKSLLSQNITPEAYRKLNIIRKKFNLSTPSYSYNRQAAHNKQIIKTT